MQPRRARTSGLGVPLLQPARCVGCVAPVRPTHGVLVLSCPSVALRVCSVLGRLAPVHRCLRPVCCVASAVSWATWLLFTGVLVRCVVLRVRCPGPLGSRSPVRPLGVLCRRRCQQKAKGRDVYPRVQVNGLGFVCCVHAVRKCVGLGRGRGSQGDLVSSPLATTLIPGALAAPLPFLLAGAGVAPATFTPSCCPGPGGPSAVWHAPWRGHARGRCVSCVACAVSRATWLLFTGAPARCVPLRVQCPGPLGTCSPVCPLGVLCCVCGVLGHLAPVHRSARSVCCGPCAVSWATWLLFTGALARCVALRARCPGPLGSCSPMCQAVVSRPFVALGARACAMACVFAFFSPRSLFLCFSLAPLFLLACLGFLFGGGGGWAAAFLVLCVGVGVCRCRCWWGRGCCGGPGFGWLPRSGFPACAPAPRLPVSRTLVRGVLTAGGWRLWWLGACVGGSGPWVEPGWRRRARARVWVCSWRGLMGWWVVWAWLVCVGVGYVCAEGAVGWVGAL